MGPDALEESRHGCVYVSVASFSMSPQIPMRLKLTICLGSPYSGRVYLEWARLVAPNRKSMDFVYTEEMEFDWDREAETTDEEEAD
jgi:hypothetical protein